MTKAVSWVQLLAALCAVGSVLIALERRLTRLEERQAQSAALLVKVDALAKEITTLRVEAAARK
jgi:hypothetical protein